MRAAPELVGWMPSAWFRSGTPATPSRRKGTSVIFVLSRKVSKHLTKSRGVLFPEVRRRLHADQQHWNRALPRPMDDALQIFLHLSRRQASQPIVGPERKNQQTYVPFESPARSAQSVSRSVARHAGVDDLERSIPASRNLRCSTAGYASSRGMPRPAVRLSPSATMRGVDSGLSRRSSSAPAGARRMHWVRFPPCRQSGRGASAPPHEIAASTTRERRTRFNLLYLTPRLRSGQAVVYSRPWSPSPFSRRWRAREPHWSAAGMPTRSASSRRR